MTKITQNVAFDAAHRLLGYPGNCSHCHGHAWAVFIEIQSNRDLDTCGMLLDYRTIKNYIKETFDHRAILNIQDPLVDVFKSLNLNVTTMSGNPTAENIAKKILHDIIKLAGLTVNDFCHVVVCESPDNTAEEYL